jgi:hypothetical protein
MKAMHCTYQDLALNEHPLVGTSPQKMVGPRATSETVYKTHSQQPLHLSLCFNSNQCTPILHQSQKYISITVVPSLIPGIKSIHFQLCVNSKLKKNSFKITELKK